MSKKLLLLGGGHAEIPLIQAAQKLGYFVITTGNAREGLGHPYADKNVFEDFSDLKKMLALAEAEGVDRVCSGCNDFALLSAAYVCEKLGLPGHDSYETSVQIHHKDKYRALATRLKIPTPKAIAVHNAEEFEAAIQEIPFPNIIKPVELTGGKGIHRAENALEARAAYAEALKRTREDRVVVEEFVVGTNHGFSAYLQNQKVVFYFADNEQYYLNKYMVSGANTPTTTSSHAQKLLCEYSERIAKALNLVDGILHIQYIEKADGTPVIIEICRRAPGDLYIKFVQYATGVDYPKMIVQGETGEFSSEILPPLGTLPKPFLRHCIMAKEKGVVQGVSFAPEIQKNIVEKFLWLKKGELVEDPLYYKAGIVFMQFSSAEELYAQTSKMTELIQIDVY
ncbi:MAG: ATP-grasp domain-containing protein [Fibrobacter sp.]|nr:ATP-grasp domain-containing protein [Fibrobacter sp.]